MTTNMNRFFIEQEIREGELEVPDAALAHQLLRVLRKKPGDEIVLLDNSGRECVSVIQSITKGAVSVRVASSALSRGEPARFVALYQSIIKKDKMEWVFEKGTEAGVSRFVPVLSAHAVKLGVNAQRARKIIQEAAEQSGRGKVPTLAELMAFERAVSEAAASGAISVLAHNAGTYPDMQEVLKEAAGGVNLFIGPEGGFGEEEVALAKKSGFIIVSLGPRTLRAETAAVVASFLAAQ